MGRPYTRSNLVLVLHSTWCKKLIVMLGIKIRVNIEVKLGVGSKTGSKNLILAFLKVMDGSVLAFLNCTDGSVLVFQKCMDGSVLAHLRFPMQSAPTRFPQSGNSEVPQLLCKKSTKMSYLKGNGWTVHSGGVGRGKVHHQMGYLATYLAIFF